MLQRDLTFGGQPFPTFSEDFSSPLSRKGFRLHSSREEKRNFHSTSFARNPQLPTCSQFLINFLHSSVFLLLHSLLLTASSLSNLLLPKISGVLRQAALPARHNLGPLLLGPIRRGHLHPRRPGPQTAQTKLPSPLPPSQARWLSVDQHTTRKAREFLKDGFFRTVCKGRT